MVGAEVRSDLLQGLNSILILHPVVKMLHCSDVNEICSSLSLTTTTHHNVHGMIAANALQETRSRKTYPNERRSAETLLQTIILASGSIPNSTEFEYEPV